jgi:hypothetical protein
VPALLSAAYGTAVAPSVLDNIERAAKSWSQGDDFTAHIHLWRSVERVPLDPTFPYSVFHIPWIAYVAAEYAAPASRCRATFSPSVHPTAGF